MAHHPAVAAERPLRRRVVKIDAIGIVEVELHPAERALVTGTLLEAPPAIGGSDDTEAMRPQITRMRALFGPQLLVRDRARHVPGWIEDDAMHFGCQHRRFVAWPPGDRAHRGDGVVGLEHGEY